jgi:hypothetical protein
LGEGDGPAHSRHRGSEQAPHHPAPVGCGARQGRVFCELRC